MDSDNKQQPKATRKIRVKAALLKKLQAARQAASAVEECPFDIPEPEDLAETLLHKDRSLPLQELTKLSLLLTWLNLAPSEWDAIIFSDGSGSRWTHPAGTASVIILREEYRYQVIRMGMSHGTNNVAEMLAIAYPLLWLHEVYRKNISTNGMKVHVLTDSQVTANILNTLPSLPLITVNSNRPLWHMLLATVRGGIWVHAVHVPRNTHPLGTLCDELAGRMRKLAADMPHTDPAQLMELD